MRECEPNRNPMSTPLSPTRAVRGLTYYTYEGAVEGVLDGSGGHAVGEDEGGHIVVEQTIGVEHYVQQKPATCSA